MWAGSVFIKASAGAGTRPMNRYSWLLNHLGPSARRSIFFAAFGTHLDSFVET